MNWLQTILAVALIAGAILGWLVLHRRVRGDDGPLIGATKRMARDKDTENDLDAFIAAYRGGKIDPVALNDVEDPSLEPATIAATAPLAAPPAAAAQTGTLLRPEVKLAYLAFRSGLRDHHVFANVRLSDLGFGTVVGTVDLLVCDSDFKYVAAIDVSLVEPAEDIPKASFLRRAGLKHVTLKARAIPKPGQLRDLIYGQGNQ